MLQDSLKQLRKERNITQEELSKATGIGRSRIGNYESGLRKCDFETAEIFADYFNCPISRFIEDIDNLTFPEVQIILSFRTLPEEKKYSTMEAIIGMIRLVVGDGDDNQ